MVAIYQISMETATCLKLVVTSVQCVPEEYPSDEEDGEHQSLSLHLSYHLHAAGPQHHSCLQHQRQPHKTVRFLHSFWRGAVLSQYPILVLLIVNLRWCSQNLTCLMPCCRFKYLNDINSNHYLLFHSGTRWLSFWLDFMAATMTLLVALFVVLSSNDFISPALKGLAMSYTIQVKSDRKFIDV